jgi:hypothetical protein
MQIKIFPIAKRRSKGAQPMFQIPNQILAKCFFHLIDIPSNAQVVKGKYSRHRDFSSTGIFELEN